jgi:sodium transport system permease protein
MGTPRRPTSATLHIFAKETREMMRDRRVRSNAFFAPIFLIAMFLVLFGFLTTAISRPESHRIHAVASEAPLVNAIQAAGINVQFVDDLAEGRDLVRDRRASLVLDVQAEGSVSIVRAVYDPQDPKAPIVLSLVRRVVEAQNQAVLRTVLEERGISPEEAEPFRMVEEEVRVGEGSASEILIGFLPYLIVIWAFYGGMSVVADMVAGEKEKQTLETLLIAPIGRGQIALGKFLALGLVCLLSSLSSLVGVVAMGILNLPITRPLFEQGIGVTPLAFAAILLVLLPTVAFFSAMLLAISAYARNVREAQTQITMVSFIVIIPAIFSQFIGFTTLGSSWWISLVPVLNAATSIRDSLMGRYDPVQLLLTVLVSTILAIVALWISVALFRREEVLVRV